MPLCLHHIFVIWPFLNSSLLTQENLPTLLLFIQKGKTILFFPALAESAYQQMSANTYTHIHTHTLLPNCIWFALPRRRWRSALVPCSHWFFAAGAGFNWSTQCQTLKFIHTHSPTNTHTWIRTHTHLLAGGCKYVLVKKKKKKSEWWPKF